MTIKYTKNFSTVVALITHLGATNRRSRTPTFIGTDLGLDKQDVVSVLRLFPSVFRESKNVPTKEDSKGDHFYTLHLRYSRRTDDDEKSGQSEPLSTDEIGMLLDLVAHMTHQEQQQRTNMFSMLAAIVASASALIAAYMASQP